MGDFGMLGDGHIVLIREGELLFLKRGEIAVHQLHELRLLGELAVQDA